MLTVPGVTHLLPICWGKPAPDSHCPHPLCLSPGKLKSSFLFSSTDFSLLITPSAQVTLSLCLLERQRISSSKLSRIWRDTWRSWRTSGNSRATFISRSSDVLVLPLLKQWKGQLGRCWVQTESLSCQSEKIWNHLSHGGELYQVDWVGKYHLLWRDHSLTGILDWIDKEVLLNTGVTFSLLLGHGHYVNNCFRLLPCWLPYQDRLCSWTMTFLPYVSFVGVLC